MLVCSNAQSSSLLFIVVIIKFAVILFLAHAIVCVWLYVCMCVCVRDMRDMRGMRDTGSGGKRNNLVEVKHSTHGAWIHSG